ncbi:Cytochrome b2, mitochondrial [Neolecta irregularis DAH-3]|uniref:L-lactate dehydrogenase (cytochrome) n=1 Tax=Neolecta irregularis (strain DAH-3) TaxID=1198029 RepID=A0A1U7LWP6_NEOID|nr:Cytochrome b2, mitochondrial [Neolecta irregularis DAH-3]|eukprot:OLL26993.1 Cytochrome b2, mitochondrial [Neolecta irregularis DAH-3]
MQLRHMNQFIPLQGIISENLPPDKHLGEADMSTIEISKEEADPDEKERLERIKNKPLLVECFNLFDFEFVARHVMKKTAWAYYSSGADDEITMRENHSAFAKIWFKPRILVDVDKVDYSTIMLGTRCSAPFYVTATALGKLGHPEGETVLTKAAHTHDIIQMIPTLASCSFEQIRDAAVEGQTQWLQLYVNKDRSLTKRIVQTAEGQGIKGLFITVDAPQLGRREKDMRSKFGDIGAHEQRSDNDVDRTQGVARAISSFIDPSLSWQDIPWFQTITKMPIVLKGVQCAEDAIKAVEYGVQGIVVSNHGGRQLDYARSGIEILVEVMAALRERNWQDRLEVFCDGGIRRATDIIKAIALGAKGVGIGRPFLYAMSAYGVEGVERAMLLLKQELEMNMRLIGATKISDLNPTILDLKSIGTHSVPTPTDVLSSQEYDGLLVPKSKPKAKL